VLKSLRDLVKLVRGDVLTSTRTLRDSLELDERLGQAFFGGASWSISETTASLRSVAFSSASATSRSRRFGSATTGSYERK